MPRDSDPAVSVIIPTRNRPVQLVGCLRALSELTYPKEALDIVVVDDGGTADLDEARSFTDLRVTVLAQAQAGPAAARNTGAGVAKGEFLAFVDDDCRPSPDWVRRLVDVATAHPGDAVGGSTLNALTDNPFAEASQLIINVGYRHANARAEDARFFTTNNLLVPAAGFRELGGFDPAFRTSEDRDFCNRWLLAGKRLRHVPDAIVFHRHEMGLKGFLLQHLGYGRGAYRFHRASSSRGTPVQIEPSFYARVFAEPFRHARGRRAVALELLLQLWNVANTAGYLAEWAGAASGRFRFRRR